MTCSEISCHSHAFGGRPGAAGQDALVMEVLFHSGSVYQYFDVPQMLFQEMLQSDSIGGFLNEHIKGSYRYVKL